MLILIHGDNIEASRNELVRIKSEAKGKDVRELSGKGLDEATLIQSLESSSLFGSDVLVVVENLLTNLGKKQNLLSRFISILASVHGEAEIVIWEPKEISKTTISKFGKNVKVIEFKTPVIIFSFLDTLSPNKVRELLDLLDKTLGKDAPELVFAMLVKRIRQLIQVKDNVMPEGVIGWQMGRLTNQARLFTMEKLLTMEQQLLTIDYSIKSGSTPFRYKELIGQFLIDL